MNFFDHLAEKLGNFQIVDAIQIILVAVVIGFTLIYAKNHNARTFAVILIFYYAVLCVLGAFGVFSDAPLVAALLMPMLFLVILFGSELKRSIFKLSWKNYSNYIHSNMVVDQEEVKGTIQQIVKAMQSLSKQDIGALIIIVPDTISDHILESGTRLQADLSSELLETVFIKNAPLHDGAVIIKGNKILAAGCYLPLSQSTNIPKELGTRHRGAIGVTESNPSVTAIVVSEETGIISAMHDGNTVRYLDGETLAAVLEGAYMLDKGSSQTNVWRMDINEEK
jgi:diadenylate cyclase